MMALFFLIAQAAPLSDKLPVSEREIRNVTMKPAIACVIEDKQTQEIIAKAGIEAIKDLKDTEVELSSSDGKKFKMKVLVDDKGEPSLSINDAAGIPFDSSLTEFVLAVHQLQEPVEVKVDEKNSKKVNLLAEARLGNCRQDVNSTFVWRKLSEEILRAKNNMTLTYTKADGCKTSYALGASIAHALASKGENETQICLFEQKPPLPASDPKAATAKPDFKLITENLDSEKEPIKSKLEVFKSLSSLLKSKS